jgi:hypothetical protein
MTPDQKIYLTFALIGFVVGMLPGFIIGCAYMQRTAEPRKQAKIRKLRVELAGREASLREYARCGYGNSAVAEDIAILKAKLRALGEA